MKIVADENIPFVREAFGCVGDVVTLPGRAITNADLGGCQVLLVRSVTKVNAALLDGTSVRYVATATIGTDHLDAAYLDAAGIRYASAPGSNAASVADWFTAALLTTAQRLGLTLEGRSIGVIGCGNVGSRVLARARALGMRVLENDPPLARKSGDPRFRAIDELYGCEVITVHTPLTRSGPDPTWHLVNGEFLNRLRPDTILINSARGGCVDSEALKSALKAGTLRAALLDVWEHEPTIDWELLDLVQIGTPHIAGYAYDGKVRGTLMIYRQVCDWLGVKAEWDSATVLPPPDVAEVTVDAAGRKDEDVIREAVLAVYPLSRDDAALRTVAAMPNMRERAEGFDRLRKQYPRRREMALTGVHLKNGDPGLEEKLRGLTFQMC